MRRRPPLPRALGASLGLLVDIAVGEPPIDPHPVAAFGEVMERLEAHTYQPTRVAGAVHAAVGTGLGAAAGIALAPPFGGGMVATAAATALAVAGKGLGAAAVDVAGPLARGDLDDARAKLPALVGRDPTGLDAPEIARAVVESVAENTVDAVVAPACWAAVAGAPGVLAYRAVNTLDAMVGHRSPRYEEFGWASARLDDAANWVPARLTAALVAAVRPATARDVARAVRTDAPAHPSPNSGVAEAAFAAALGLTLGGTNRYGEQTERRPLLGRGRAPEVGDIDRAVDLSQDVSLALAALLATIGSVRALRGLRRRRRR
jgi:adenosylcobinamide-phosphate synthase